MKKGLKKVMFLSIMFVCSSVIFAQTTVTGKISDSIGPLPGASVVVKNTEIGATSDFDGNYSIEVPSGTVILQFSFIGYQMKEVAVNGRNIIDVTLYEDTETLDEIVVTALGIRKETKALGYAMTEVKGEELAKVNTVNPVAALQGKVSGISIGASDGGLFGNSKIQIRGVSTLNSNNNQPIFVIDGVILENGISNSSADWSADANDFGNGLKNLNADDYESISVLKGAAAAALYGSRGINGVILIKTKDGSNARGLGVSVKQSIGFDVVYKQPGLQSEYGPGTLSGYINYGEKDANDKYYDFDTSQFQLNSDGIPTLLGASGLGYGPKFDGRPIVGYDEEMTTYSASKNNMLSAYEMGNNTNTSLTLKAGNEKGNFYLSNSYNKRTGILPNNSFERNSLLFKGAYQLATWLKANASVAFTTSGSKNPRNDISQSFFDGTFSRLYNTKKYKQQKYWQAPHGGVPSGDDNYTSVPNRGLWFVYEHNNKDNNERVTRPIITLTASVTDWLKLTVEGNMNYHTGTYEEEILGTGYANAGGSYLLRHKSNVSKTGKLLFNLNKNLTKDITGQLLLGSEIWSQENSETQVRTDGGLTVPGRFYLGNSKLSLISNGGISNTKQLNSLYFHSSFGYKDQLYLDITGRNDWSSSLVFTNGKGNNSYFYPSVSSSWLLSETFDLPFWVTFGKLRLSWASVGNDTGAYAINTGYGGGKIETTENNFIYTNRVSTTLVDVNIKPERKNSFEIGADIRLFNNRLGIDFAYYDDIITEQIGTFALPEVSGYGRFMTNIGTLTNNGIELSITGTPIKTEDFKWNTTFNYWKNNSKVTELHKLQGKFKQLGGASGYGNFRVGSYAFVGGEYGVLMSDSKAKVWKSDNPEDSRNGMKILSWSDARKGARLQRSNELEEVGKIQPDFEGSWNNSFSYRGLTLSVLLDARFGGHIASYSSRYGTSYGFLERSLRGRSPEHGGLSWTSQYDGTKGQQFSDGIIIDGVFEEGQMVTIPDGSRVDIGGLTYQEAYKKGYVEPTHASYYNFFRNSWGSGVVNDDWFTELKYIALRNISIGYNLPNTIAGKMGAKRLYIGINGRNLTYLYNSLPNDINPESFRGTSSTESFRERSFSPYLASYTMTIAIDF